MHRRRIRYLRPTRREGDRFFFFLYLFFLFSSSSLSSFTFVSRRDSLKIPPLSRSLAPRFSSFQPSRSHSYPFLSSLSLFLFLSLSLSLFSWHIGRNVRGFEIRRFTRRWLVSRKTRNFDSPVPKKSSAVRRVLCSLNYIPVSHLLLISPRSSPTPSQPPKRIFFFVVFIFFFSIQRQRYTYIHTYLHTYIYMRKTSRVPHASDATVRASSCNNLCTILQPTTPPTI